MKNLKKIEIKSKLLQIRKNFGNREIITQKTSLIENCGNTYI